jgi:uncharacterized protein YukE
MADEARLHVDLEALAGSAALVFANGEDLASAHLSSDNAIAAAQAGWVGDSAAALQIKAARWLETSRRLLTSVGDHALELNNDGIEFAALERDTADTVAKSRPLGDD